MKGKLPSRIGTHPNGIAGREAIPLHLEIEAHQDVTDLMKNFNVDKTSTPPSVTPFRILRLMSS